MTKESRARWALLAVPALLAPGTGLAQAWPDRPVRVLVGVLAGGGVDLVARTVAEGLGSRLGQQFVVDNRPGATSAIMYDLLAKATPDGYTLGATSDAMMVHPFMRKFDPYAVFAPIALMAKQPLIVTLHAGLPPKTIADLVSLAKAKPNSLSFGTASASQHLTGELVWKRLGIPVTHIPYKGGSQVIVDVAGGQIPLGVLGASIVLPQARAGRVRMLAVTSAERSAMLPQVPGMVESGAPGVDVFQWLCLMGPAALPKALIARIEAETVAVVGLPLTQERLATAGMEPAPLRSAGLLALWRRDTARWAGLVKETGIQLAQ